MLSRSLNPFQSLTKTLTVVKINIPMTIMKEKLLSSVVISCNGILDVMVKLRICIIMQIHDLAVEPYIVCI